MFVSLFKALCFPFFFSEKQLAFSSVLRILSLIELSGRAKMCCGSQDQLLVWLGGKPGFAVRFCNAVSP